jgi:HEAT repeat protein
MKRITLFSIFLIFSILAFVLIMGQIACEKPPTRRAVRRDKRVAALKTALKSDSHETRVKAVEKLANMGPQALGAVEALIETLGDENAELRAYSALALGKICKPSADAGVPVPEAVVPALRSSMTDTDGLVRVWSALAMFRILPQAEPEIKVIADVLENMGKSQVRIQAAVAIIKIGPRAKDAVPALITALDSPGVRRHAAYALGAIGPEAGDAIGALTEVSRKGGAAGQAAKDAIEKIRK